MSELILRGELQELWRDKDVFALLLALDGEVVRDKEGRQTMKFELAGKTYYRKLHTGIGWREIFKNFLQLKLPVTGAINEWQAINRVHELGLDSLNALAYGSRGHNPARKLSFLVTAELTNTLSLAQYAEQWPQKPPAPRERRALIRKVAGIARTIHGAGINHRDLYICHFLLDLSVGAEVRQENPRLFLVDLHRAQMRASVPRRWLVKDIASIYFSSLDIGLTKKDVYLFLQIYFDMPLREIFTYHDALLNSVTKRAVQLYRRDFKRLPVLPFK
ncbi:MAG: lipopolysaccharide core heptose(I) kinase RfaP [Gammaproteobacteria bacterium]|nr:lipopolysaccharide core heptose(I) kinase RfaP [Gammaproteobacteria bacterium]MBQ0841199.1 lipopolysaccharide core heptose(I) kinase RfaP [Gammaproteobacteria bacterium]